MEKRKASQEGFRAAIMYAVFVLAAALFIWIGCTTYIQDMRFDSEKPWALEEGWTAWVEGKGEQPVAYEDVFRVKAKKGDTVVFQNTLPEEKNGCNSLIFYSRHQRVRILLNGELLADYGFKQKTPFHMSPGCAWQLVRLPDNWPGAVLTIELAAEYNGTAGELTMVHLGTKNALVFMVIKEALFRLLLNVPILFAGVALVFTSFLYQDRKMVQRLRSLGIFAIIISSWLLMESRISQFFTGNPLLAGNLIFLLFGLLPIVILRFLLTYEDFERSRFMRTLYHLSAAGFLLLWGLQIVGVLDAMQMVSGFHVLLLLIIAGTVVLYVRCQVSRKRIQDNSIYYAGIVFAFFGLVDILRFYLLSTGMDVVLFSRIGLLCFITIMGVSAVRQASENRQRFLEQMVLEKIAYTDIMTGLANRTAFEQVMDCCREDGACPRIIVLDLNGLKYINDNFGHKEGDRAIQAVAGQLLGCFAGKAQIFRIGGDEFCVIGEGAEPGEMEALLSEFERKMLTVQQEVKFPLSVACGVSDLEVADIDAAFLSADQRMYEQKERMKQGRKR